MRTSGKYGATRFETRWDPETRRLLGLRFAIIQEPWGELPVRLQAQTENILEILRSHQGPRSRKTDRDLLDHAERIAWRQLKDVVEQLLLAVETGLWSLAQAFMAHVEVWDEEARETVTMSQLLATRAELLPGEKGIRLLPAGEAR